MPLGLPNRDFYLARETDRYVADLLAGYKWLLPREPKLVRDAVHGYQLLAPYEVAVIDSPLVQRLRHIHQTALAHLVYPTATHTRFDHSLGVAKMVNGMMDALRTTESGATITDSVVQRVRLAALLHDTGHVLFSHLGEDMAENVFAPQVKEAKAIGGQLFEAKSLGEITSYLMVTSPAFADPLDSMLQNQGLQDVNSARIAPLILGQSPDDAQQYEANMISGPFDADKLDYLLRDCHFSGIRTTVDIERVYYTVRLLRVPGQARSLAMHIGGVPNLEQILFAKMILYTSVYHHQKVRALECQFRGIVERLLADPGALAVPELRLQSFYDWLRITEFELLAHGQREPVVRQHVSALLNRRLLKRALVISLDTVTKESQAGLVAIYNDTTAAARFRELRQTIYDAMGKKQRGEIYDLWLDVPKPPNVIRDVLQVKITADQTSHRPLSTDRFQWEKWTNNYGEVKWRSHIFCADSESARRSAAHAATRILKRKYGIAFTSAARELAKN